MPSTITYVGRAPTVAQVSPFTVATGSDTTTYKLTGGNGKVASYTAGAGDTSAQIAAALAAAWEASAEPEIAEVAAGAAAAVVSLTGPADGTPFTVTPSVSGGTGTLTAGAVTAASSPNHLNKAANYSGNALPANGDTVVFELGSVPVKWELDGLAAVTFKVTRRDTYTGSIGLPPTNAAGGYPEYRQRSLKTSGVTIDWRQGRNDAAGQFRVEITSGAAAVTATIAGSGAGRGIGSEPLELTGLPAASVLNVSGAGVALAPLQGQTATVATLLADAGSAVRGEVGLTLGAATVTASQLQLDNTYTTLIIDKGAKATVRGAAAGTTSTIRDGSLTWLSSGNPGDVALGATGTLDANAAPAGFAIGSLTVVKGSTVRDKAGRIGRPWDLVCDGCSLTDVRLDLASHLTVTIANGP